MLGVGGITEKHSVEQRAITGGRNSLDGNTRVIYIFYYFQVWILSRLFSVLHR